MKTISTLAVAFLVLAACSTAPPATTAPVGTQTAAADAGDKTICRNMPVMGSNFTKKTCATRAEWEAFAKKGQEGVDQLDDERSKAGTQGGLTGQR